MPMMRGVKFACEPCIRGHRSSKCNHSDRVLVQVRKPGRPLSSCPHTLSSTSPGTFVHALPNGGESRGNRAGGSAGVSCSCDVTSVAIPKVASCACGTPKPQEPPPRLSPPSLVPISAATATSDSRSTITSPTSPTFPAILSASSANNGPSSRIVKPQRPKKNGQARKGSVNIGEVALEQLIEQEREGSSSSTESLKMEGTASSCGGMPGISSETGSAEGGALQDFAGHPRPSTSPGHGGDIDEFRPSHNSSNSQNGSMFLGGTKTPVESDHRVGKPDMPAAAHKTLCSDAWNPDAGSSPWQLSQTAIKNVGCGGCGGNSVQQSQPRPQHYIHCAPVPQNTQQGPSCCNNPQKAITIQPQQMAVSQIPFPGHSFFPSLQYPSSYIPPTNFSQVSNMWMYPTIHPAITPQEFAWLQQQRAAGVFGPQPTAQLPGHVALASPMSNPPVTNTTLAHGWEHNCHCGPECNCLGCATHPFNRRTVEHVREMQSFMAVDDGSLSPQSHPNPTNHNHPHSLVHQQLSRPQPQQDSFEANGMSLSSPVAGAPPGTCCGSRSSPAKQISPTTEAEDIGPDGTPTGTPTGTPSGTDAVDELSPSNFLYFDYPLGVCAQTEAGCKCGEGCTCVGCITHGGHDGVELEAPVQAPEWEAWGIEEDS